MSEHVCVFVCLYKNKVHESTSFHIIFEASLVLFISLTLSLVYYLKFLPSYCPWLPSYYLYSSTPLSINMLPLTVPMPPFYFLDVYKYL